MKTSTGKQSPVGHSTGKDKTKNKKARRGHRRPRTSTGDRAGIVHATGQVFDMKRPEEAEMQAEPRAAKTKPPQAA